MYSDQNEKQQKLPSNEIGEPTYIHIPWILALVSMHVRITIDTKTFDSEADVGYVIVES